MFVVFLICLLCWLSHSSLQVVKPNNTFKTTILPEGCSTSDDPYYQGGKWVECENQDLWNVLRAIWDNLVEVTSIFIFECAAPKTYMFTSLKASFFEVNSTLRILSITDCYVLKLSPDCLG